jgi:hypothetical protein
MKKYLLFMGAAVLIAALAAPAAAQMLTKSWGHLEVMTVYESKPDFNTGSNYYRAPLSHNVAFATGAQRADQNLTHKTVAERFRLGLQHGDEKTVRAVIEFEANSSDWGEPKNTSTATISTGGQMGVYGTDQVQLQIRHGYLQFIVPNTPVTVTAGLQLFQYGGRLYVYNDAPGVKVTGKFAPHQIEAAWWRENDNSRTGTEIRESYALEYRLTQKDFNFYAWGSYLNQNLGFIQDHPYWLGVGGGFKPGNWNFTGQFIYVGGSQENRTGALVKKDYSAFALEAAGKYQIGPGMSVGLEAYYSTGNDANQTDKINMYQVSQSSEARAIFGIDRTVFFWMNAGQFGYWHNREIYFEGMWYGRANFEFSPARWARLNLNYLYIGDNSSGTPGAGRVVNSPLGARQDKDESFVGHEINLITTLVIYKNIVYNVGLGYFIPGSIYDKPATATPAKSAEAAYGINTNLKLVF